MEKKYDPKAVEKRAAELWEAEGVFKFDPNSPNPIYSIDTPPPTVSGDIHLGHVFSYTQSEFIARYKRLRGYNLFFPFGLDNNGLPTEILIEKKFNVTPESIGGSKFVNLLRGEIPAYNQLYVEIFKSLGMSVDWSLSYETISNDVQKTAQTSFLELVAQGRAYRKNAPVIYCPKEKTALSQMELEDKKVNGKLYRIKFDESVTIATTRPELLPSCVALFISPGDERYTHLAGKSVKVPLFDNEVKVIEDKRVDPEFGTGIVMCCTFGDSTDVEWYKEYGLDLKVIINKEGNLEHPYYGAVSISEGRKKIVEDLKSHGLLLEERDIQHTVNVHERCGTEVEFIVKPQWYIKYLDLKDIFIELGRRVNWHPEYMRVRYENWVNGLKWDWGISRQRFFGVAFPVWYCAKCGKPKFAEIDDLPVDPKITKPSSKCECGSDEFAPETDVMDTWATSSLTPLINGRWKRPDSRMERIYPMNLRPQAHDIISFRAFTTIVKSYLHTNSIPWKDIMISGHGLNADGSPMHKSGKSLPAKEYIDKYGADIIRYWASSSALGLDSLFEDKVLVAGRRIIVKLWNISKLVESQCLDTIPAETSKNTLDAWILDEVNKTSEEASKKFDMFDYFGARRIIESTFWEFADDYTEFVKDRVYAGERNARYIMRLSLISILKMLHPFIPFVTEYIYQDLFRNKEHLFSRGIADAPSIQLSGWPEKFEGADMNLAQIGKSCAEAARLVRRKKSEDKMPLNAEIKTVSVPDRFREELNSTAVEELKKAIKAENINFTDSSAGDTLSITYKDKS